MMADSAVVSEFNPNDKDKLDEKSSRKANKEDIEKMGLLKGFMMVLGYFKKKPLMMRIMLQKKKLNLNKYYCHSVVHCLNDYLF